MIPRAPLFSRHFRRSSIAFTLVLSACSPAAPPPETPGVSPAASSAEDEKLIAGVLDDWHDAASKADEERYFGHLSEDSVFLGTDAAERWNKKAFRAYAHPHFAKGKAWSFRSIRRAVVLAPAGDAAWFDEDLETEKLGPARGSGALLRTAQGWQIALYNLTIPIPNDQFDAVRKIIAGDPPPPAPAAAADGPCGDVVAAGRICGSVTFTGTPPAMVPPPRRKDADFCKLQNLPHDAVVVQSGRLADVAIRVVSGVKAGTGGAPTGAVVARQLLCMYSPRVQAATVGRKLAVHNDDPTLHNIHAYEPGGSTWFNQAQPRGSAPVEKELEQEGIVRLTDDVFPWMHGFVVVSPHAFIDVTDQTGDFSITSLPPGPFALEAWHSIYGTKRATVTLKDGEGARVTFSYDGKEPLAKENPLAAAELKSFR